MRPLAILALAFLPLPLAGCFKSAEPPPASVQLPPVPSDIRSCFVGVVDVPPRALTIGEVERLWKEDRIRSVAMRRCGTRLTTFYDTLRRTWR